MGLPRRPERVNLIVGLLSNDITLLDTARRMLMRSYGPTDLETPITDFTHTDYYRAEMGSHLKRQFLSFRALRPLGGIYRTKLRTNRIECDLSRTAEERPASAGSRRRTVNIDPGYLDLSKVVLFSTKDFTHRVYLDKGIYAEVTLFYKDKSFRSWPWTYPDYRTGEYIAVFNAIRDIYIRKVRGS